MSWFRNLAETYDRCQDIVGIPIEKTYKNEKGKAQTIFNVLPPLHFIAVKTDICVIIDGDGNFRDADPSELSYIIIPCTEDSSTRSSNIAPHPLHEQLGYLTIDKKKREKYLSQLEKWKQFNPKVEAVYKYVYADTLIDDLQTRDIKTDNPRLFIRFSVEMPGDLTPKLWEDSSIAEAWFKYYEHNQSQKMTLCYATGKSYRARRKHPRDINHKRYHSRLISSNDDSNYTYRGRFTQPEHANSISDTVSQKVHAMLQYLIATQGYKCDAQAIVAWAVDDGNAALNPFAATDQLYKSIGLLDENAKTDGDKLIEARGKIDFDYAKMLRKAFIGRGSIKQLHGRARQIAVISVDVATEKGNMAVTFYKDLPENDYIDRIVAWHESCCWLFHNYKKNTDYISAPSTDSIIAAIYGEPTGDNYDKIKKQARERILHCILDGESINSSWLFAAVNRVSNPFSYSKPDGGWDKNTWKNAISVTCAIVRKYYTNKKEEFSLELDTKCSDRSYLFGRLLALADKIEDSEYYHRTKESLPHPTNAVRYMSAFATNPFQTWKVIYEAINNSSLSRMKSGISEWYQKQIDEIISLFKNGEFENKKPLDGKYLMGYSLQRIAFKPKNNEGETENVE